MKQTYEKNEKEREMKQYSCNIQKKGKKIYNDNETHKYFYNTRETKGCFFLK